MVNWFAVGFAASLVYILPKRYIVKKILNFCKYRTLKEPPKTVIAIIDDIGMNFEKCRIYAKNGGKIIIGGKSRIKLEMVKKELIQLSKNKNIVIISVDKHDKFSLRQFAEKIIDSEIAIYAIINNSGKELKDLDLIFTTQELAKERFTNHCTNFLYNSLPEDL